MANHQTDPAQLRRVLEAFDRVGTIAGAATDLEMNRMTYTSQLQQARYRRDELFAAKPFDLPDLPEGTRTAHEILKAKRAVFARKRTAQEARELIAVTIKTAGPVGIIVFGDPHVDDDGCDVELLERHIEIANSLDALLPIGIGDYSNNWVGRLARLYAQQSTGAAEAWVLVEWFVQSVRWLALVSGNHDAWSGDSDPIKWMAKIARVVYESHGARLGLTFPNGRVVRLNARHDFAGRSQYNTVHGPAKAAMFGWRDHVLVAGHTHQSGHNVLRDPSSGLLTHALRIGSYKTFDRYALERGLPNQTFTVAPTIIIRPQFADDDTRLLTVFYEPETAADFLRFLRRKKSEAA